MPQRRSDGDVKGAIGLPPHFPCSLNTVENVQVYRYGSTSLGLINSCNIAVLNETTEVTLKLV